MTPEPFFQINFYLAPILPRCHYLKNRVSVHLEFQAQTIAFIKGGYSIRYFVVPYRACSVIQEIDFCCYISHCIKDAFRQTSFTCSSASARYQLCSIGSVEAERKLTKAIHITP